ncbi:MAG TPA: flagellar biosynthetic protein FliO [Alphaproteobacteria bacterium]|nr:flagellar biosynthetic protein FliO [Alphaproteobacteria bacterium]
MDYQDYLKFFAALVFVLCLMGGLAFVMKRLGMGQSGMISPSKKRLKIVEILPLDARRKAMIIQRDDIQHLVVLGPSGETVIETNIKKPKDDKTS